MSVTDIYAGLEVRYQVPGRLGPGAVSRDGWVRLGLLTILALHASAPPAAAHRRRHPRFHVAHSCSVSDYTRSHDPDPSDSALRRSPSQLRLKSFLDVFGDLGTTVNACAFQTTEMS